MDSTIYASRVGHTPNQAASNLTRPQVQQPRQDPARMWADKYFGSTPYQGQQMQRNAPTYIYGGGDNSAQVVQGANAQPDIPVGTMPQQPEQHAQAAQAPSLADRIANTPMPPVSMSPESAAAFKDDASMEAAGLSPTLPTTPPKMPKDPTDGKKEYDPNSIFTGQKAITYGMQNNMPQAQSPVQAQTQAADHDRMQQDLQYVAAAKNPKQAWQEVKKDPFYKNSDFYTGLMNVGLAIMSGANPMQAFQAGKGAMDKATMATQMGGNKQALIDQGYSPASVEAAITSGDASKLQMQQMSDQDRMAAEDQIWGKRQAYQQEATKQAEERSNQEWARRNDITNAQMVEREKMSDARTQRAADDALKRQLKVIDYKDRLKQKALNSSDAGYTWGKGELTAEQKTFGPLITQNSNRFTNFQSAEDLANKAKEALAKGDNATAAFNYKTAVELAAKAQVGGQRSIDPQDVAYFTENPDVIESTKNGVSLKAGYGPTVSNVDYLIKGLKTSHETELGVIKKAAEDRIKSHVAGGMDPHRATVLVNKSVGGAMGGQFVDPYNVLSPQAVAQRGALAGQDTSADLNGFSF